MEVGENNKFPNKFMHGQFESYLTTEELGELLRKMSEEINSAYKGERLLLVATLKGSVLFLSELAKRLTDVEVYFDFIQTKTIGRNKDQSGTIVITQDITTPANDKHVLVIEDIIDSARTTSFVAKRLESSNPLSVKVCTLFDRPHKRAVEFVPDYKGLEVDQDFIIGLGLDFEEHARHLETIYYLKYSQ